jgi:hypothetical protein
MCAGIIWCGHLPEAARMFSNINAYSTLPYLCGSKGFHWNRGTTFEAIVWGQGIVQSVPGDVKSSCRGRRSWRTRSIYHYKRAICILYVVAMTCYFCACHVRVDIDLLRMERISGFLNIASITKSVKYFTATTTIRILI